VGASTNKIFQMRKLSQREILEELIERLREAGYLGVRKT
jgi:hypothetical protein